MTKDLRELVTLYGHVNSGLAAINLSTDIVHLLPIPLNPKEKEALPTYCKIVLYRSLKPITSEYRLSSTVALCQRCLLTREKIVQNGDDKTISVSRYSPPI